MCTCVYVYLSIYTYKNFESKHDKHLSFRFLQRPISLQVVTVWSQTQ